jgi:hypothetical protein
MVVLVWLTQGFTYSQHNGRCGSPQCVRHFLDEGFDLIESFSKETFCHRMIMHT